MLADALPIVGVQQPRFMHTPATAVRNESGDAVQLMREIGMPLDPWQETALQTWLGVRADGVWAAQTAVTCVARQNGKNAVIEARELAGLFLFGERRIVHSAHQADTAREAYKRMTTLIESTPWLDSEVARMPKAPGRESVVLKNGAELTYRTRTKGGGRGFSAPVVIFDEAQELTGEQLAAVLPLVSSFPSHQLIYTGTVLAGASVFQGLLERIRTGRGEGLGGAEWSAPEDADPSSVEAWLQANPSVGYRMTVDAIQNEWDTAVATGTVDRFKQERLSIWPDAAAIGQMVPAAAWARCRVDWQLSAGTIVDHIGIASSVDGAWSAVGVAFEQDGRTFVELAKYEPGTDWVIPYVQGLVDRRRPKGVFLDKGGPASKSLTNGLAAVLPRGVLEETSTAEMQAATAQFIDAVSVEKIAHAGRPQLDASVTGVREKIVGDARMYDRRRSPVVVAPVEAVTLAAWGLLKTKRPSRYDSGDLLVL